MLHNAPLNINDCILETSAVRLSSYRNFFQVNNNDAYSIYKWNEEISSRMIKLIAVIEIILRNRIHSTMSDYMKGTANGGPESNDWFNHISLRQGAINKIKNAMTDNKGRFIRPTPSANFVISNMTYGFWPNILKTENDIKNKGIPWGLLFKSIFPGLPTQSAGYWSKLKKREPIISRCFSVGELRNRIAHFEPIWKFGDELEEVFERRGVTPKIITRAPTNKKEAIQRLTNEFNKALELLSWLSPNSHQDYINSENKKSIEWLISEKAMDSFINHTEMTKISFNRAIKARKIKGMALSGQGCSIITIKKNNVGLLFLYP
ncbi:Abi family protein [Pectobacterium parmentieri]|uniref:Abi family protein n=1 Tax=Pectobacterium parmentieri TaxID=1905730 RepID=UPI00301A969B